MPWVIRPCHRPTLPVRLIELCRSSRPSRSARGPRPGSRAGSVIRFVISSSSETPETDWRRFVSASTSARRVVERLAAPAASRRRSASRAASRRCRSSRRRPASAACEAGDRERVAGVAGLRRRRGRDQRRRREDGRVDGDGRRVVPCRGEEGAAGVAVQVEAGGVLRVRLRDRASSAMRVELRLVAGQRRVAQRDAARRACPDVRLVEVGTSAERRPTAVAPVTSVAPPKTSIVDRAVAPAWP